MTFIQILIDGTLKEYQFGVLVTAKRQSPCDGLYRYNSSELAKVPVVAYCRYYGDRFYECTAWNRLLARNHWILEDGRLAWRIYATAGPCCSC